MRSKRGGDSPMARKDKLQQWYIDHGICPVCGQRDAWPGGQTCPECREKAILNNIKYRSLERERTYYASRKAKWKERVVSGLCPRCGKSATHGEFCFECYVKMRKRHEKEKAERAARGNPHKLRVESGLCYWCDSPAMDGKKVCEKHYRDLMERFSKRGGTSHPWVKDETARIEAIRNG